MNKNIKKTIKKKFWVDVIRLWQCYIGIPGANLTQTFSIFSTPAAIVGYFESDVIYISISYRLYVWLNSMYRCSERHSNIQLLIKSDYCLATDINKNHMNFKYNMHPIQLSSIKYTTNWTVLLTDCKNLTSLAQERLCSAGWVYLIQEERSEQLSQQGGRQDEPQELHLSAEGWG